MFLLLILFAALSGVTVESPAAGAIILLPSASLPASVSGPLRTAPPVGIPPAGTTEGAAIPKDTPAPPPQTALRIPFGGEVDEELAQRAAIHAVRSLAIEQAARKLSRKPGVRLYAGDVPRLMAFAEPIHTFALDVTTLTRPDRFGTSPSGELRATARWEQHRAEDDFVREQIAEGVSLESRTLAMGQAQRLTAACLRLLRDAAILRREKGDDDPQAERLAMLLTQLDDLHLFLQAPFPPEAARLEKLLARNPGNPAFLIEYAELLLRTNQPATALDALKAMNSGGPQSAHALYLRGLAQLALRLPTLAQKDLSAALKLNSELPGYWQGRAMAHAALENTPDMCADLIQACTLGLCTDLERVRADGLCQIFSK